MSLGLRLELRQSQGLVMTPQLQQAIKLLQLNNLELIAYVAQELEQNPFLEAAEGGDARAATSLDARAALSGSPELRPTPREVEPNDGWPAAAVGDRPIGMGLDGVAGGSRGGRSDFADDLPDLEARLSRPKTLREHLLEQIQADIAPGRDRLIALFLLDQLDDAGYLTTRLDDAAATLGVPTAAIEAVLVRLQTCEPSGVFARSLADCLAIQLRERNRLDPAMQRLLDHLPLLAAANFPALLRVCRVDQDDLSDMVAEIKALDPKPGHTLSVEPAPPVVPDIFVTRAAEGGWRVELNSATLPRVLVDASYYATVTKTTKERRAREYLSERFQAANWLVKALDQRARTVLRVAEAVVAHQTLFLEHGVAHLRPLVLREIAAVTELHESTISRATTEKYIATPRGTYPVKYFFSNALVGADGEPSHAAEAIRQRVRRLIEQEAVDGVLSDDQIVDALRTGGVVIARRTVAKYREALGIPSSVQRRRLKALRLG